MKSVWRQPLFVIGLAVLLFFLLGSFVYEWIFGNVPKQSYFIEENGRAVEGPPISPSLLHPLGTDEFGFDMFAKIMLGAKYTILSAMAVAAVRMIIAVPLGFSLATTFKKSRPFINSLIDPIHYIPMTIFAVYILRPILWEPVEGFSTTLFMRIALEVVIIALMTMPIVAVLIGKEASLLYQQEFILASKTLGASNQRIVRRHLMPLMREPFRIFQTVKTGATDALPPESSRSATGPLALADVDGDGDLDLFVGGRVLPGRYPEPAGSQMFRNDGGAFHAGQSFPELGLVSGAVFTDFDGDGDPDLALACDWDSIRVFRNDGGKFAEVTASLGLAGFKGWWNGIAAGDFDGDGRLDLVVSNWGRNGRTDQPPGTELPVSLFYGDFASNGGVQTLLASPDPALSLVTPWREWSRVKKAIPAVGERLKDHHAYGRADVEMVLGNSMDVARELRVTAPDSMVFLNRGDHFEPRRLPIEAQFAPAFGVSVADFDGDGNEDIFLAQNFFGTDAETSRHDAGIGLMLLGDGRGGFRALGPRESGIAIYGEQRGSAVADFDGDRRPDLVVAQNGGPTQLFRNGRARPGKGVRLRGGGENPHGIGATVRLKFAAGMGPVRELHAGSGYWSQDSSSLILASPGTPVAVQVHWPGGAVQEHVWPSGAESVVVSDKGIELESRR